ncbi:FecR family protein [Chitinophaga niabensis]|uniref:FecR protein n=1 Tax=Chitinophaga niabensis TaxID=536979 RepID=A0A1N6GCK4_9BACT|nr:FecR domain-containing protein [Chitinophaga niabensis]SIO05300.1 protein of unknown function [Chitinophaga niabensis]
MTEKEFLELLAKHKQGNLNTKEQMLLAQVVADGDFDEVLKQDVMQSLSGKKQGLIRRLFTNRRIAAAVTLLAMGGLLFMFVFPRKKQTNTPILSQTVKQDVSPGTNRALLTLSDGSVVELDSLGNTIIPTQGSSSVNVQGGQLVYGKGDGEQVFNTLTTPRGAQYKIQLSDGTLVWLNAGSSLKYPTIFNNSERTVELQGEAYFEVAKDAQKVFHVKVNDMQVEVLGTHFNVSAYSEDNTINTTLLEGKVKISDHILHPGEQAQRASDGNISIKEVDVEEVVAWKNGLFIFQNADVKTIMQQLSRWYDIEITYEGTPRQMRLNGEVYRNYNLSQVLAVLGATGLEFKIEGKKLNVIY